MNLSVRGIVEKFGEKSVGKAREKKSKLFREKIGVCSLNFFLLLLCFSGMYFGVQQVAIVHSLIKILAKSCSL